MTNAPLSSYSFYLTDLNPEVADAWRETFVDVPEVEVRCESIFDRPADALVSPANSFGWMNGGIDFVISKTLGWHVEKRVKAAIQQDFQGELLVGQALIVPTDHAEFPFLISAPTMRTPRTLRRCPNIYLAFRALLILLAYGKFQDGAPLHSKVKSVAIPGLGTGIGQALPLVAARQMRLAWEDVFQEKHLQKDSWEELQLNYAWFETERDEDLKTKLPGM